MYSAKKVSPNVGSKRSRKSKEEEAEPEAPEQDEEERVSKRTNDGAGKSKKKTKKNEGAAVEEPAKPKRKKKKISAEQEMEVDNRSGNEQVEEDEKPAEQVEEDDKPAKSKRRKKKTKEIPATSGSDEESALMEYEKAEPNRMEGAVAQRANPPDELKTRVGELFERLKALPPSERRAQVHRSEDKAVSILNKVYALHTKIVDCFEGRSSTQAMDRLSDPSVLSRLVVPSLVQSEFGPPLSFTYVGRKKLKELQEVLRTADGMTKLGGYSGRGKSYMMAAMACYLHAYEHELGPVVYIQASRLVGRFDYLVSALLLAYVRHPNKQLDVLARASSEVGIENFCEKEGVVVLMDEVNAFDTVKETSNSTTEDRQKARTWIRGFHNGVRCASYKSTFQSCTQYFDLHMNEPFDLVELASWQRSTGFLKEDPEELLHHTGLVPRILKLYTQNKRRDKAYRRRRLDDYLAKIKTAHHYVGAMQILNGQKSKLKNLDAEIFYERSFGDHDTRVSVLPYLQAEMTVRLEEKRKVLESFENKTSRIR